MIAGALNHFFGNRNFNAIFVDNSSAIKVWGTGLSIVIGRNTLFVPGHNLVYLHLSLGAQALEEIGEAPDRFGELVLIR